MRIETYRGKLQDATKAEKYATRFETGPRKRIDQREQRAVRQIFAELTDCRSVMDVPSGAGRFLAALGGQGRLVIESDVAHEILVFSRNRSQKLKVRSRFVQADAAHLPLMSGAVDCVFCNRLLHHILAVEQRAIFLRELYRVARRYVVVSFFDYHAFGAARKILKALKGRKPLYQQQPTRAEFEQEVAACDFRIKKLVPTGALWVAQKYFVLEKA
jgi:ubiquinone/menaquinone biosynthesis C-methylase UbiE